MSLGSLAGRARLNVRSPTAQAMCQRCQFWYNRSDLVWQFYWRGAALANSGLLVCRRRCLDEPNQQFRVLILPGDPIPVVDPRPDPATTPPRVAGFQPPPTPGNYGFTTFQIGAPIPGDYPTNNGTMLNDVAAITGIPLPPDIVDRSITIAAAAVSQTVMAANPSRTWMLLYAPMAAPIGWTPAATSFFGATTTLMIGPGQAWFWSTSQGMGTVYQGAVSAVGLNPGTVLWAFESNETAPPLIDVWMDELGNLMEDEDGNVMWSLAS